jgi:excisionase family DNA binding protein
MAVGIKEAAKNLGISPDTLRRHIARGSIRAVRFGRRILIPVEALEEVLAGESEKEARAKAPRVPPQN